MHSRETDVAFLGCWSYARGGTRSGPIWCPLEALGILLPLLPSMACVICLLGLSFPICKDEGYLILHMNQLRSWSETARDTRGGPQVARSGAACVRPPGGQGEGDCEPQDVGSPSECPPLFVSTLSTAHRSRQIFHHLPSGSHPFLLQV